MSDKRKTPDCRMHEALVSYLYDEATVEERRVMEEHLAQCLSCSEELTAFERVRGMLQQWQLDDLPVVRVEAAPRRSFLSVLKELFTVMPLWAKAVGAVATLMLVLAVLGTEVSFGGDNGFSFRADITRSDKSSRKDVEQLRAELQLMVGEMILASEQNQKGEVTAKLVAFESQLHNMRQADLARLAASIEEQRTRLRLIERDIDRRDGLNLADILFSELTTDAIEKSEKIEKGGD